MNRSLAGRNAQRSVLEVLQILAIQCLLLFGVISGPRLLFSDILQQANIPVDYETINLSIADSFVIVLLVFTALRLLSDNLYRQRLASSLQKVYALGGVWWLALISWMVAGVLWSAVPVLTRYDMIHAVAVLMTAFIVADIVQNRSECSFLYALMAAAVFQSIIALLQVIARGPLGLWSLGEISRFDYDPTNFYRAPGLSMHPNYFAGFLMICLFASVAMAVSNHLEGKRIVVPIAVAVLTSFALVATLSRGALIGTAAAFSPLVLMSFLRAKGRTHLLIGGLVGAALIAAAIWAWVAVAGDIQTRFLSPREFFLSDSLEVIKDNPILGVGADNLLVQIVMRHPNRIEALLPVHNVYLFLWAELGLPGLALFILAGLAFVRKTRNLRDPMLLIWSCCLLGMAIIMLSDNYFWAIHPFRDLAFFVVGTWWGVAGRRLRVATNLAGMEPELAPG